MNLKTKLDDINSVTISVLKLPLINVIRYINNIIKKYYCSVPIFNDIGTV